MSAPRSETRTSAAPAATVTARTAQAQLQQKSQVSGAHTAGSSGGFQPKKLTRAAPIAKQEGDSPAMIAQRINGGKTNIASSKSSLPKDTGSATTTATKD